MKIKQLKFKYSKVMLLDDNELDNFINTKIIESSHFAENIYVSTNGQSALEFLNNLSIVISNSHPIYPELIFVDLNMPMMDGFQFIEHFIENSKAKGSMPKLVILTSSISEEDKIRAKKISQNIVFMHKPLTQTMLAEL